MDKVKVEFDGDGAGFFKETEKIKGSVSGLRNELLGNLKTAIFATFSIEALKKFGEEFKEFVKDISIAAKQTNASTSELQVWGKQIQKVGGEMENLTHLINKMSAARDKALEEPGGKDAKAFQRLGIDEGTLISKTGPELFRQVQDLISKSGSAAGYMGSLMELLGEKSVRFLAIFADSFTETENKLKGTGKLIESEIIDKMMRLQRMDKELSFGDALIGAKGKSELVTAIQEFWTRTKGGLQAIALPALFNLDLMTGQDMKKGFTMERVKAIEKQQIEFAMMDESTGGLSPAQALEISNKLTTRAAEQQNQLRRIAELKEKVAEKEMTDQQKLNKLQAEQLDMLKQMDALAKNTDKSKYLSIFEQYLRNVPKVKELDDKLKKEDMQQVKKDDKLVDDYMKKVKSKFFDNYQMNDDLVNTGNFLGTSRTRLENLNLQVQQRDLLKQIEQNTRLFLEKNNDVQSVEDFPAL